MSLIHDSGKLEVIELPDNQYGLEVEPSKNMNTLYWWRKGSDQDGWYVKADLYYVDGEGMECLIADDISELLVLVQRDYGLQPQSTDLKSL